MFETNFKHLVTACNGSPCEVLFETLVLYCVQLLRSVLVKFIFRSGNIVVHKLVKTVYFISDIEE